MVYKPTHTPPHRVLFCEIRGPATMRHQEVYCMSAFASVEAPRAVASFAERAVPMLQCRCCPRRFHSPQKIRRRRLYRICLEYMGQGISPGSTTGSICYICILDFANLRLLHHLQHHSNICKLNMLIGDHTIYAEKADQLDADCRCEVSRLHLQGYKRSFAATTVARVPGTPPPPPQLPMAI